MVWFHACVVDHTLNNASDFRGYGNGNSRHGFHGKRGYGTTKRKLGELSLGESCSPSSCSIRSSVKSVSAVAVAVAVAVAAKIRGVFES
jgi:hypothetical protein